MSELMQGSGKWVLGVLFSLYGFVIWAMMGLMSWALFGGSSWGFWSCLVSAFAFYFIFVISWYRKKDKIYEIASKAQWCDNITFLNDKGTVSIRTDRITEKIDLNATVKDIESITKKDHEFLRIKLSVISDYKMMHQQTDNAFENVPLDDDDNFDDMISTIKELDEKKLASLAGYDNPLELKYNYFKVINILEPRNEWIPLVSKRKIGTEKPIEKKTHKYKDLDPVHDPPPRPDNPVTGDASGKKRAKYLEELESKQKELEILKIANDEMEDRFQEAMENNDKKKAEKIKDDMVKSIGKQTEVEGEIFTIKEKLATLGYVDTTSVPPIPSDLEEISLEDDPGEETVYYDDDEEEDTYDANIAKDDEIINFDDLGSSDVMESYEMVNETRAMKALGNFKHFLRYMAKKGRDEEVYTDTAYRVFNTDVILSILAHNDVDTVEDLRNADKIKLAKEIGMNNEEMMELVKFIENNVKDREIKYWRDLIPRELRAFLGIKMAMIQTRMPGKFVYLVTFAEPVEFIFPKNVIAKPYMQVEEKPLLSDELIVPDRKMFEQAIYILPDEFERCLHFTPGGIGTFQGYQVSVPITYATFVLKGWMTNSIPILKAIATSYDVRRELDDYKHYLAHEHIMLKAMVGYVNHIKSNTSLNERQVAYTQQELETVKDDMERQRQFMFHQMYYKSGGFASTDLMPTFSPQLQQSKQAEQEASSDGKKKMMYAGIGFMAIFFFIIALMYFLR